MKNIILLTFIFTSSISFSQIPNGGFEEWEVIDSLWYPSGGWETLPGPSTQPRFERSSESVEGDFSLKFLENKQGDLCYGYIYTTVDIFPATNNGIRLEFFLKEIPLNERRHTNFTIRASVFYQGSHVDILFWENTEELTQFEKKVIGISTFPLDSINLFLFGGGVSTPLGGCTSPSEVWLDDLKIVTTTTISETIEIEYQFFPNPTRSVIKIQSEHRWNQVKVYSDLGQLLMSFDSMEEIDISSLKAALYYVDIEWSNGGHTQEKVLKI